MHSVRQLNIIIKESFTTLHEPRFSAHDKSRKLHGFTEITENLFYMKWAASFVIFESYVRILSLKHHFMQEKSTEFENCQILCFLRFSQNKENGLNHLVAVTPSILLKWIKNFTEGHCF